MKIKFKARMAGDNGTYFEGDVAGDELPLALRKHLVSQGFAEVVPDPPAPDPAPEPTPEAK